MGQMITLNAGETQVAGYLATPDAGRGSGVLLLHAWWGLNGFFKAYADRLAGAGFVVFAPDLYGNRVAATIEEADQLSGTLRWEEGKQRVRHAVDYLLAHPARQGDGLGAAGFSMGGSYALWLAAQSAAVKAVVLCYSAEHIDDVAGLTRAAFLGHFAEDDAYESPDERDKLEAELKAAGRTAEFHIYPGTTHWFVEADRDAYNEAAAALAWERTVAFLRRELAG